MIKEKQKTIRFLVRYEVKEEEFAEFSNQMSKLTYGRILGFGKSKNHSAIFSSKKKEKLIKEILALLSYKEQRIGILYKLVKEKGHEFSYKTFQRRVTELILEKKIKARKQSEPGNNTTYLTRYKND